MSMTIAQTNIASNVGREVKDGEVAIVPVDGAVATDATAPFAIRAFNGKGETRRWNPERITLVLDHSAPAPDELVAILHRLMREFASETGSRLYEVGEGICHQLMIGNGRV